MAGSGMDYTEGCGQFIVGDDLISESGGYRHIGNPPSL